MMSYSHASTIIKLLIPIIAVGIFENKPVQRLFPLFICEPKVQMQTKNAEFDQCGMKSLRYTNSLSNEFA